MIAILRIILLLFLSTIGLSAQTEFAPIGSKWVFNIETNNETFDFDPLENYFELTSRGDTLIGDKWHRQVGDYLFYQDGDEVYYLWNGRYNLIYKFDIEVSDRITFQFLDFDNETIDVELQVKSISNTIINGVALKRFEFEPHFSLYNDYVYTERIGSDRFIIENRVNSFPVTGGDHEWLRCYHFEETTYLTQKFTDFEGNDCYYSNPTNVDNYEIERLSIFPNPVRDVLILDKLETSNIGKYILYDTHGMVVQSKILTKQIDFSQLPTGIYFFQYEYKKKKFIEKVIKL